MAQNPLSTVAAAQKVALAASTAALLMFGALIYNGAPRYNTVSAADTGDCAVESNAAAPVVATTQIAETVATSADTDEAETEGEEIENKVRRAVSDLIRDKYPNSKVEGVFLLAFGRDTNLYLAGADTVLPDGRRNINCLVRQYVKRGGATYWRAESLSREEAAALEQQAKQDSDAS